MRDFLFFFFFFFFFFFCSGKISLKFTKWEENLIAKYKLIEVRGKNFAKISH